MLFLLTSYFKINSPTIMAVGTISQQIIFQNPENICFKHTNSMILILLWFCSLSTDAICLLYLSNLSYIVLTCYLSVFWTMPVKWFNSKTISVRECNIKALNTWFKNSALAQKGTFHNSLTHNKNEGKYNL